MTSFLVLTTHNLPEAYFLVDFLLKQRQPVAVVNLQGRPKSHHFRMIKRLKKKYGRVYVLDLLLGKLLLPYIIPSHVQPFPDLTQDTIQSYIHSIPYFESHDLHDTATLSYIKQVAPDYILAAGVPILRKNLFGISTYGTLNRHLGWAPTYRGSDCPLWTLSLGAFHEVGFIVHYVTKQVDRGDLLMRKTVPIPAGLPLPHFLAHLQLTASTGYVDVLDTIISHGELTPTPQASGGTQFHFPPAGLSTILKAKRNYNRFLSRGDWRKPTMTNGHRQQRD
ncbi:MAG: hypothetical protein ETSY1_05875 [Candidatus Entotheonella factor]|uniref:Formyl transferase N-terminal domain-containing protein n=1 Tax=Entotheonella factor TaxID=1429438 RepID=W4LVE0_ENTF1|nr:formyltransferase family protein [Candidatus Entotheonella palauensis]ETX01858.1 MAG: hypothetical protein ETSY1_05875 [Candidatus Entotheonella factor]